MLHGTMQWEFSRIGSILLFYFEIYFCFLIIPLRKILEKLRSSKLSDFPNDTWRQVVTRVHIGTYYRHTGVGDRHKAPCERHSQ